MVSFRNHAFVLGLEQDAMFSSVTRQFSMFNLASQRENELLLSSLRTELVLADNEFYPRYFFRKRLHLVEIGMHPRGDQS